MNKLIKLPGGPHVSAGAIVEVSQPENLDENHWVFHVIYNRSTAETVNFCCNLICNEKQAHQQHYNFIELVNSKV